MKLVRIFGAVAALALALTGCSAPIPESEKIQVVASTNVWGDIAASIGGDYVHVTSIIDNVTKDPHTYEATARDLLAVKKADLLIANGGGYDDFMDKLAGSAGNKKILRVQSAAVSAANTDNEHYWYSLRAVQEVASQIANTLATIDQKHASEFVSNFARFGKDLTKLSSKASMVAAAHQNVTVFSTEALVGLLLSELNIADATPKAFKKAIEEGTELSPKVLSAALQLIESQKISAVILNEQTSNQQIDDLVAKADDAGVPVIVFNELLPPGKHYVDWMQGNLETLDKNLPGLTNTK